MTDELAALPLGLALVGVLAATEVASRKLRIPSAIVLVIVGVVLAALPAVPNVMMQPDLVLLLMLPPLIYSSGVGMSWRGFRANLRPILLLAVGCVLFTAAAVAAVVHYAFGVPWAVGFILGAIVSPPDPVAPMAILRSVGVPQRALLVLEGEGLVNDATALTVFGFAVAAVVTGQFSLGGALGAFAVDVVAELAWGAALGWAMLRLRAWSRDAQVEIILGLMTPFIAFWPAHALGGSGVLAALTAGLWISWNGPRFISPATRLQGFFVWGLVIAVVEGLVFLLSGMQAHIVVQGMESDGRQRLLEAGALTSLVVVLVRFVWVYPATYLPRWLSRGLREQDPSPPWTVAFLISFAGLRGGVSLVAALSIPLTVGGAPFPERDLVLFSTFCVIVVTLVGQGLTLPWVVRRLGLDRAGRQEAARRKQCELAARVAGIDAAIKAIDSMAACGDVPDAIATSLRRYHRDRRSHFNDTADPAVEGSPVADYARLQYKLIDAERAALLDSFQRRDIDDGARRRIERELDLEEARMHHAAESAIGQDADE